MMSQTTLLLILLCQMSKFTEQHLKRRNRGATRLEVLEDKVINRPFSIKRSAHSTILRSIDKHRRNVKRLLLGKAELNDDFARTASVSLLNERIPRFSVYLEDTPPLRYDLHELNYADLAVYNPNETSSVRSLYQYGHLEIPEQCPICETKLEPTDWLPFTITKIRETPEGPKTIYIQKFGCPECSYEMDMTKGSWLSHFRFSSFRAIVHALICFIFEVPCNIVIKRLIKGLMKKSRYYELVQFFRSICTVHLFYRPIQFHKLDGCHCFDEHKQPLHPVYIRRCKEQVPFYDEKIHTTQNMLPCTRIDTNIVALDEAFVGKSRKYAAGRFWQRINIFGISSTMGGFAMMVVVPSVKRKDLLPHILRTVCPQMKVYTDMAAAYCKLSLLTYEHEAVNHSEREYVNPVTGATTNSIEGEWGNYKKKIAAMKGLPGSLKIVNQHLGEYSYRSCFMATNEQMSRTFHLSLKTFKKEGYMYGALREEKFESTNC